MTSRSRKPTPTKHDQATIGAAAAEKARRIALGELREIPASKAARATPLPTTGPTLAHGAPGGNGVVSGAAGSPVPPKPTPTKAKPKGKSSKGKPAKDAKAPRREPKAKKPSGLDAVAIVLSAEKRPMNMKEVFAETQSRKLWTTKGQTPEATLYAAVIREIAAKGKESRFKKTDRGLFTINGKAG